MRSRSGSSRPRPGHASEALVGDLAARYEQANAEILHPVLELLGLDAVEVAVSGAAPIPVEILEFFRGLGLPLSEIYGLSETSGPLTWEPEHVRLGTVGPPVPGLELRLATDGEVQCRGGNIFRGYLEDPERTAEALSPDGWFATGDIGELDPVGYLRIVDRKKELIITAGGKNISPANIEAALRAQPLIGQACVFGDGQPFVVGLLVLDPDVAPAWAATHGVTDTAFDALARDPVVLAEVGREVDEANERFAHAEHVTEVEAPPRRVAARLRGAHAHDEAQATRDRGEVRARDRGAIRLTRPRRSRACARSRARHRAHDRRATPAPRRRARGWGSTRCRPTP